MGTMKRKNFFSFIRYELNVSLPKKPFIFFVVAGFLQRMEPSGLLLVPSSPLSQYV